MALITKPDMEFIWASGGAVVKPSDVKIQTGWNPEVPPHQWENWIQKRQDEYLAHINQRGIPEWDGNSEYEAAGLSYVQGSDGVVYKSVAASGPATTVQDPTTDVSDTYWTIAFASTTQASETVQGIVELATTAEAEAGLDDERAMTPLKVKQAIDQFASSTLPLGYFSGFTLTNNSGAPNNTIDIGAGAARNSTNTVDITSPSTTSGILQSSGSWTAGNNQNKLDTGSRANSTTYHVFKIYKTSDGSSEDLFSLSATAPTMPSGYAGFRRIGRIVTDGSGNIRAFKDRGNGRFDWVTPSIEATVASVAAGTSLLTLSGMGGVGAEVRLQALALGDAATVKITASDITDQATGVGTSDYTGGVAINAGGGSATESSGSQVDAFSDASGQVRLRTYVSAGNLGYRIIVFGWREVR